MKRREEGRAGARASQQHQHSSRSRDPRVEWRCNWMVRLFMLWLDPLFFTGFKRSLDQKDLYAHPREADSEKLLEEFNRYWKSELDRVLQGQSPRLWLVILKCLWKRFLLQGVLVFAEVSLLISQSVVLGYLSDYFNIQSPTKEDTRDAYLFAAGIVFMALFVTVIHAHAWLIGQKLGMMARIIATGAIYQKVLALSQLTLGQVSTGHIVNLASNDVQRLDLAFLFPHFLWVTPLHVTIFTYLGYSEIGWPIFLATAFIVLQIPIQILLAQVFAKLRLQSAGVTDNRVKVMNEVISGIQVIKMYAWEYAFKRVVSKLRRKESSIIFRGALIRASNLAFMIVSVTVIMFIVFLAFTLAGGELTPKKVFTPLSLLLYLRITSIHLFVSCVLALSESKVAITRIQKLLVLDEVQGSEQSPPYLLKVLHESLRKRRRSDTSDLIPSSPHSESNDSSLPISLSGEERTTGSVKVTNMSASWNCDHPTAAVLNNISFELSQGSRLLVIVGPVGAGKSTLLQCLLGELEPFMGDVEVSGQVSYASQEAWVFSGTLKDNVLFGLPYDEDRYESTIEACALDKDIDQLLHGDLTLVGERGVTLSGGQKARVNLARAVYREADVYLLDDPLSAVDTAVGRHLFEKCIQELLKDKSVVLVTHQLQFAVNADRILAIKNGRIETCCSKKELEQCGRNLSELMMTESTEERDEFRYKGKKTNTDEEEIEEEAEDDSQERELELKEHLNLYNLDTPSPKRQHLRRTSSSVSTLRRSLPRLKRRSTVSTADRRAFRSEQRALNRKPSRRVPRVGISFTEPSMMDITSIYTITHLQSITSHEEEHDEELNDTDEERRNLQPSENVTHGSVTMSTYYRYFNAGGGYLLLTILLIIFILAESQCIYLWFPIIQGGIVVADWWISNWASCSVNNLTQLLLDNDTQGSTCALTNNQRLGVYTGVTVAAILLNFARAILFYFVCVNASRVLHNRMFASILRAPMLFFDANPIGRVLNRFSKDIGFLDDLLPYTFCEYLLFFLRFLAIIFTAASSNVWVLLPAVVIIVIFLVFRWYYLKTSREIKRLEAIARSPLYSHISTTLIGLSTIRSANKESMATDLFHKYQNEHTQGWWLYIAGTRWFGMRIDVLGTAFLAAVAFSTIPLASALNAGLVGLGLTYAISLAGLFQYCVRLSAEVENIMISVERVMEYSKLEPEAALETLPPREKPAPEWPHKGEIDFSYVYFRYSGDDLFVLKNLSFCIQPCEKIGIVGRTGAGKSSLIAVLFRMAEPFGLISIDSVETKDIGLHDLRRKISIIPQDPVLFSGTIRYNLDPFDEYADTDLWGVLEQVQLKSAVESLEGGLLGQVSEGGSNFSVGQRQLVCLARALLRKNKILVLDEATANVDIKTDAIVQQTIREKFSECTVLTIAHRLNTIMDSDRILVFSKGRVREFDSPYALLQNPLSLFSKMVQQTGFQASNKLHDMAEEAYRTRKRAMESLAQSSDSGLPPTP